LLGCLIKRKISQISCFDLDHTLLQGNSSFQFGVHLYRQGLLPFATMLYLAGAYGLYQSGLLSLSRMQQQIFTRFFQGLSRSLMTSQASSLLDQVFAHSCYSPAVQALNSAKREGHYTLILSSGPDFLVEEYAKRFGVDGWRASQYTTDAHGHFSTIDQLFLADQKAQWVQQLISELGIEKEAVAAYSDSILDLPFLLSAGHPVAVRPDSALYRLSQQNNWLVI
jgi:HAD superfamily hydrolase (TIGR01490 family)